jgi:hypothetical protein
MEGCYRSTPKLVGAFFDALYQNPTTLLFCSRRVIGISRLVVVQDPQQNAGKF